MEKCGVAGYLMEEGWKARERLDFAKSEFLLNEAKSLFEELEDWHNVTECLNHLAYLYKVKAFNDIKKASDCVSNSLRLCAQKKKDNTLSLRAASSIYKYAGEFEKAEKYLSEFIESQKNPAARGDMRGDLAYNYMRRGNLPKAKEEIELAIKELNEGWEKERMPHKMIWKTKLLMFKSLIFYNDGKIKDAKILAEQALALSKEHNLKMRTQEAQNLVTIFS